MMNKALLYFLLFFSVLYACKTSKNKDIRLGQGILAGETSDNSVILQARLTQSYTLINGHLKGQTGWLKFT